MAKKLRTKGTVSSLPPPQGAPAWTVCEGWKGAINIFITNNFIITYLTDIFCFSEYSQQSQS